MTVTNITLSADTKLIKLAREKAAKEKLSLNALFREWLSLYTSVNNKASNYKQLMKRMKHIKSNKKFTRDELNDR